MRAAPFLQTLGGVPWLRNPLPVRLCRRAGVGTRTARGTARGWETGRSDSRGSGRPPHSELPVCAHPAEAEPGRRHTHHLCCWTCPLALCVWWGGTLCGHVCSAPSRDAAVRAVFVPEALLSALTAGGKGPFLSGVAHACETRCPLSVGLSPTESDRPGRAGEVPEPPGGRGAGTCRPCAPGGPAAAVASPPFALQHVLAPGCLVSAARSGREPWLTAFPERTRECGQRYSIFHAGLVVRSGGGCR